jgi:hypothetical protein
MDTEGSMYRPLSNSCSGGPCPTFYVDDATGDVIVQGYTTGERPGAADPDEGFLHIPAAAWKTLLDRLPR